MDDAGCSNLSSSANAESENDNSSLVCELLNSKDRDEDDDDIGEYYFESDHLALRNNADYRKLLKAVVVLQAQRTKALQDIDRLLEAKEAALADPIAFVEKLQRGEDLNLPKPQQIYKVPAIDWSKYAINGNTPSFTHKHMTRHKKPVATITCPSPPPPANDSNSGSSFSELKTESDESTPAFVRGRISNMPSKSQTFNQLWSAEEQQRLENLLVKYPPEEVEARRWEKIAKALGNRTPQQVASRVQKYFIKLAVNGYPVPGRIPHVNNYGRRLKSHRHQRHNRFLHQNSTFFATREPPVFMSDYDEDNTNYSAATSMDYEQRGTADEDDELISPHLRNTAEYQELMYLKRLKKEKEQNKCQSTSQQQDFKCGKCGCEPTLGRHWWHCLDCPPNNALNLCDDCSDCNFETLTHVSGHRLEPVGETFNSFVDGDYTQFEPGNYNYLDPNYMPAS